MSRGYRLHIKAAEQQRPFGVALLATLGVLGCMLSLGALLFSLWNMTRFGIQLNQGLAVIALQLVLTLIILRINWAFWEMLKWAWWANFWLTLLSLAGSALMFGYTPLFGELASRLLPELANQPVVATLRVMLIGSLTINLLVLLYLFSVRKIFGVGVKDERPLWQKVQRH